MVSDENDDHSRVNFWIDVYHGDVTSFSHVIDDLLSVRVVYLGETHRIQRHHEWQHRIIQELVKRGKKLVIGLEQIEEMYQEPLNQFNEGKLDYSELAKAIDWNTRWPGYEGYREIIVFAQESNIPLVALNAKAEIIRKIGKEHLDGLSKEERGQLPKMIMWENDPIYRKLLDQIFMVHMPVTSEKLTPFFQAQVARDENMAQNLVKALKQRDSETVAVVIAGSGHMNYGLGIPPRVRKRLGDHKERIILFTNSGDLKLTEEELAISREVKLTPDDLRFLNRPKSDYLFVTEAAD